MKHFITLAVVRCAPTSSGLFLPSIRVSSTGICSKCPLCVFSRFSGREGSVARYLNIYKSTMGRKGSIMSSAKQKALYLFLWCMPTTGKQPLATKLRAITARKRAYP